MPSITGTTGTLTGKAADDYLEGGSGSDTYVINSGDGNDSGHNSRIN